MIRVLWLTSDKLGCGTYRAYVPALSLQDSGVADNDFVFHDQVTSVEKITEHDLEGIDVVVFQRAVGTMFLDIMKVCRERGIATAFEFDDNVFDLPKHNPSSWFWRRKAIQKVLRQELEHVDRVIVSTKPLQDKVVDEMGWKSTAKVRVCMNHVHPAVWGRQVWGDVTPYQNTGLVIGWQGSATHDTDFKMALPALWKVMEEFPDVMLRMFGSVPLSIQGIIPDHRFQWTRGVGFEQYPATLRFMNFDIGIAPITDSFFNHSKSNIKWLEYSALGIPAVCSRVYPYERSVTEGVTGFLAETSDEWYERLRALVVDADLRQRIGGQAQAHVWQTWSHVTHAPRWAEALTSVVTPKLSLDALIAGEPPCTSSPIPTAPASPSTSKTDS